LVGANGEKKEEGGKKERDWWGRRTKAYDA
jgi:hypothetical protein